MPIAIGDIHGCLEPLQRLVERLPREEELVFLGDYVDRGPSSAGVVQYLRVLGQERPCHFLMGNHEQLMMVATVDPASIPVWLQNGGGPTLQSYGISEREWLAAADRRHFLMKHYAFYKSLPYYWEDEDTIYVHAGIDLGIRDMASQTPDVLLWIRDKFFGSAEHWTGKQIVFGHTPTRTMGLTGKAIFQSHRLTGIGTGCVYGGYLTAWHSRTHELWQERSSFPPPRS